jgi:hypothetical protein
MDVKFGDTDMGLVAAEKFGEAESRFVAGRTFGGMAKESIRLDIEGANSARRFDDVKHDGVVLAASCADVLGQIASAPSSTWS